MEHINERLRHGEIELRATTKRDIDFVVESEQHPDNAPFIRLWPHAQHKAALADRNIGHFIVQEVNTPKRLGHVILVGMKNPDLSLEFKRIVIREKGRSFGRAAIRIIKTLTFERLKFHRLWLEVVEDNKRAKSLYESEGFITEGVHREALRQGDTFRSLVVMSMLAGEYVIIDDDR